MSDIRYIPAELQDSNGNVIYPHSEADVIFMADGSNVQTALSQQATDAEIAAVFVHNEDEEE